MSHLFHFRFCLNFIRKLTPVPHRHCLKQQITLSSFPFPHTLHKSLINLDYLFIIKYIPENTLKPRWFLVQIIHKETKILKMDSQNIGDYDVTLSRGT